MITEKFATKSEAARLLGVNATTIWRWIRSGKLAAEKVGNVVLISREELTEITKSSAGRKAKT